MAMEVPKGHTVSQAWTQTNLTSRTTTIFILFYPESEEIDAAPEVYPGDPAG